MRAALGLFSLMLAFVMATWVFGWPAVPAVAITFGALAPRPRAPVEALGASLLAWFALLAMQAARGPVDQVVRTLGGVTGVPGWVVILVTLSFGAVLAWSGAVLGGEIGRGMRAARAARSRPVRPDMS